MPPRMRGQLDKHFGTKRNQMQSLNSGVGNPWTASRFLREPRFDTQRYRCVLPARVWLWADTNASTRRVAGSPSTRWTCASRSSARIASRQVAYPFQPLSDSDQAKLQRDWPSCRDCVVGLFCQSGRGERMCNQVAAVWQDGGFERKSCDGKGVHGRTWAVFSATGRKSSRKASAVARRLYEHDESEAIVVPRDRTCAVCSRCPGRGGNQLVSARNSGCGGDLRRTRHSFMIDEVQRAWATGATCLPALGTEPEYPRLPRGRAAESDRRVWVIGKRRERLYVGHPRFDLRRESTRLRGRCGAVSGDA